MSNQNCHSPRERSLSARRATTHERSATQKAFSCAPWLTAAAFVISLVGCSAEEPTPGDAGGAGGTGAVGGVGGGAGTGGVGSGGRATGGAGGAGATGGTSGTGGASATGGMTASGGMTSTGGVSGSSAGTPASGGNSGAGMGGTGGQAGDPGAGGMMSGGRGGRPGSGGMGDGGRATGGSAGMPSGGTAGSSGTCMKGQTVGSEVVVMGESFYAIAPQYIVNVIQDHAREAGSLDAGETYRNVAVSGQNMNYIATTEWNAATQGGAKVSWVIMDGGGIDCLSSGGAACSSCPGAFEGLLDKMATAGVKGVIYTRYPEPGNPPGSNASLKMCLDATMPNMEDVCAASVSPPCHWVDLRPVWVNGDTSDGLHPTQSGGDHVGDLIWSKMVDLCFAQ
jgi:hypothetical protein